MSSKDDLPHDVIIDILSRLRVKTLIRFRCVSKSWHATIESPNFITMHLNRACFSDDAHLRYLKWESSSKQIWCLLSDHVELNQLQIPFNSRSGACSLAGSFNGLVCLSDLYHFGRTIFLWNPSIRKSKTLPGSSSTFPIQLSNPNNEVILGFGFHPQTNDYKVVRIIYFRDLNRRYIAKSPPQVEVYTLRTDSWRRVRAVVPYFPPDPLSTAFINGSVHWMAGTHSDMILSFDIGAEAFREMMLPNFFIDRNPRWHWLLTVLKESLSLCVCFEGMRHCDIWVMRTYGMVESWTKQFSVVMPLESVHRSLGFTKNNELLLITKNGMLVSYDLESQRFKNLGIHGIRYSSNVVSFLETLVSPERENALMGQGNSFDGVGCEGIRLGKWKSRVVPNHEQDELKKRRIA